MRIGIDIGGVIISQDTDEPDLFFSDEFLRAKSFPECFPTIHKLVEKFGKENIFIISKCGLAVQKKSIQWLKDKDFFTLTGFDPTNINFCFERHEKAPIAERLQLNYFIDDRYSVLKYLLPIKKIQRLILFCPNDTEKGLSINNPSHKILEVRGWEEIGEIFVLR